jgi:hypothetical protein
MKPRRQPTFPPDMKPAPEVFEILYPPTEDGHLTEEMKKWPLVTEERPRTLPPQPAPSEPKSPAQAS